MILFLNEEERKINLYGPSGEVSIPFSQINKISEKLEGKTALYITHAIEVDVSDIINLVRQMGCDVEGKAVNNHTEELGMKYLHSNSDGNIYIDSDLKFEGKFDIKPLTQDMLSLIQNKPVVQKLINNNKLEIIGESTRRKLMSEFKEVVNKQAEKQKVIDAELDSIILKERVADFDPSTSVSDEHADAITMDVSARSSSTESGGFNTMSELLNEIEGI